VALLWWLALHDRLLVAALDGVDALVDEPEDVVAVLAALLQFADFLQALHAVDVLERVRDVGGTHLRRVEVAAVAVVVLAELLDAGLDEPFRAGAVLAGLLGLQDVFQFVDVLDGLDGGAELRDVVLAGVQRLG
jgi:hypothetical protein